MVKPSKSLLQVIAAIQFGKIKDNFSNIDDVYKANFNRFLKSRANNKIQLTEKHFIGAEIEAMTSAMMSDKYSDLGLKQEAYLNYLNEKFNDKPELRLRKKLYEASTTQLMKENQKLRTENKSKVTAKEKKNRNPINAPVKALFCGLVNNAEVIKRGGSESVEDYCIKVCERYDIKYTKNTRKTFSDNVRIRSNNRYLEVIKELILPKIPEPDREQLIRCINSKTNTSG